MRGLELTPTVLSKRPLDGELSVCRLKSDRTVLFASSARAFPTRQARRCLLPARRSKLLRVRRRVGNGDSKKRPVGKPLNGDSRMRICSCIVVAESGDQPFTFCCLAIDSEIRYVIRLANFLLIRFALLVIHSG
jgi:hypothetical protein